jgi:hypothetical protein
MTTTRWANYILDGEFRAGPRTNSGVFLRTPLHPTDPSRDCYEWNIAPSDNPFPTGSLVQRKKAKPAEKTGGSKGEWQKFALCVVGGTILSNAKADYGEIGYRDESPIRIGYIGLQSREGPVAFRNLRLKPMSTKPLFDGKNLDEWNTERGGKCKFEITDKGELHLTNGQGQIETVDDFSNFVLQLECKVNGDGLNSGIFFRTLRKGQWAGYESQIHNGFKEGDRTKPKDFGTGAIYRRQAARRIVADDRKWFTKTIVADGPHFAVWVNGYQVSDWTDTRPEKESGREGLRLAGGAIAIQGHDATTDFLFRNIRVAELPEERSEGGGDRSGR